MLSWWEVGQHWNIMFLLRSGALTSSPSRPPTPAVRHFPWPESSVCGSLGETCQPNSSLWEYLHTSGSLSPALFWRSRSLRCKRDGKFARYTPPLSSLGHVGRFIIKITKSKLLVLKSRCIMGCGVAFRYILTTCYSLFSAIIRSFLTPALMCWITRQNLTMNP